MKTSPIIHLSNISHRYGNKSVLSGINLSVNHHEFACLNGPSGCGKSTLAAIMCGLIRPTSGTVNLHEKKNITLVSQEDTLFPWKTVFENVKLGMRRLEVPERMKDEKIICILEELGLIAHKDHFPIQLSGGLKQRVHFARALAFGSDILVLDEPFNALDSRTSEQMHEILLRMWEKSNLTIVFISHSMAESIFLSDTIYIMKSSQGEIASKISVDLVRPREVSLKKTKKFAEYERMLFSLRE